MLVWRNFERRSWPSLVVLSPQSVPILILSGEGHRQVLDIFLSVAYDFYYEKLDHSSTIQWQPEEQRWPPRPTWSQKDTKAGQLSWWLPAAHLLS